MRIQGINGFSFIILFCLGGCSLLQKPSKEETLTPKAVAPESASKMGEGAPLKKNEDVLRFSENPNIGSFNERRYRRVTRKSLEEENEVGSRAGSLWNTDGPSSYLFTQNKLHREGDLLNIKLEGTAKSQIDTKVQVIKKLLARLETSQGPAIDPVTGAPMAANANGSLEPAAANPGNGAAAPTTPPNATGTAAGAGNSGPGAAIPPNGTASANGPSDLDLPINIDSVPTRVTERLGDGNYRVKGQQSVMIGKKEFRVIVTGLIRPEDFSDEGVSSNKLLEPQVDIVSLRRSLE